MGTALDRITRALAAAGSHQNGNGNWNCPGPGHERGDQRPGLHVVYDGRGAALTCHTGCDTKEILAILGLAESELFDQPLPQRQEVARYPYRDEQGTVLFTKVRYEPKSFLITRQEGGQQVARLGNTRRVLYRLPELIEGIRQGKTVWCVEGEADADRLAVLGETATTNFDGATQPGSRSKWRDEYTPYFRDADVIVIADRDEPGRAHAKMIHEGLKGTARSVKVMQSRTEGKGDDVSDHLDAGYDLRELVPLETGSDLAARIKHGGCILDAPKVPLAIWGKDDDIFWASGQSLIVAGHDGTGKTTLAGNLIRARLGAGSGLVLGLPVTPGKRNILVLMMDRPQQAMSSLARLFTEADRKLLDARLRVWTGPPPQDLAQNTALLAELCALADADTCIIDSLKDAAIPLTDDAVGAGWNRARQAAIVRGVELLELHHPRKPGMQELGKPPELSDLYGSRWIPAGIGSAIVLHGRAGEPYVKLFHRKPVVSLLGPWDVLIRETGEVVVDNDQGELVQRIAQQGQKGVTVAEVALWLYGSDTRNEIERARRTLEKMVKEGLLRRKGSAEGRTSAPAIYWTT